MKTYTGAECAALIKNALNESVANGTSPEIKLMKLAAEMEGNYVADDLVNVKGAPSIAEIEAAADDGPSHALEPDGGPDTIGHQSRPLVRQRTVIRRMC